MHRTCSVILDLHCLMKAVLLLILATLTTVSTHHYIGRCFRTRMMCSAWLAYRWQGCGFMCRCDGYSRGVCVRNDNLCSDEDGSIRCSCARTQRRRADQPY